MSSFTLPDGTRVDELMLPDGDLPVKKNTTTTRTTEEIEIPEDLKVEVRTAREAHDRAQAKLLEFRYENLSEEPRCPEGCGGVLRQKCMWDQGPGCPRSEVVEEWGGRQRLENHMALVKDGFSPKAAVLAYGMLKDRKFEISRHGRTYTVGRAGLTAAELVAQARRAVGGIKL